MISKRDSQAARRSPPKALAEGDRLVDVEELCAILKVKKHWVYDQTSQGRIPFVKVGGHLRFRLSAIEAWLDGEAT